MDNQPQTCQETSRTTNNADTKPELIMSLPTLSEGHKAFLATLTTTTTDSRNRLQAKYDRSRKAYYKLQSIRYLQQA